MAHECCPMCKSSKTTQKHFSDGTLRWICNYQGCNGKFANDRYTWFPGEGLLESENKKKPEEEEEEEAA